MDFLQHRLQRYELLRDFEWHYDLKDSQLHREFLQSPPKQIENDSWITLFLICFALFISLPSTILNIFYDMPHVKWPKVIFLFFLHFCAIIGWLNCAVKRWYKLKKEKNSTENQRIPVSKLPKRTSGSATYARRDTFDDKYGLSIWFSFVIPFIGNIFTQHQYFHLYLCSGSSSAITNALILLILPSWLFITNQVPHIRNIFSVLFITGIIFSWGVIKLECYEMLPFIWMGFILYFVFLIEIQLMKYK